MEMGIVDIAAPSEIDLRITALDRAINYHQSREADPNKVIDTAETFLDFVKGTAK